MFKKLISLLIVFFVSSIIAKAVPAYPYKTQVLTSSGMVDIMLCGDESTKWGMTIDGYALINTPKGWFHALLNQSNVWESTKYELCDIGQRSEELNTFLHCQNKYLSFGKKLMNDNVDKFHHFHIKNDESGNVVGSRRVLVVLMEFSDVRFSKSKSDFEQLFNEEGYSHDGAKGSVRDYYSYVSNGKMNLTCDVIGPFTAKNDMKYYGRNVGLGSNDANPYLLFTEALEQASKAVNLTLYDGDEDGYIDNFHIIYAGYGEEAGASSDAIWAHEMSFNDVTVDGLKLNRYSCAPELRGNKGNGISRIGPHCHEIGHALGAMDYYDTDYSSGGQYDGTGRWDVMASGSWNEDGISPANFNPYVKAYDFGWASVVTMQGDTSIMVEPVSSSDVIYRINTPVNDEFFLVENVDGKFTDSAMPGSGLMIFHIGSNLKRLALTNDINSSFPQQCYPVCASSDYSLPNSTPSSYGNINSNGCPFPGANNNTEFSAETIPTSLTIDGQSADFAITNITRNENGNINLDFAQGEIEITPEPPLTGDVLWQDDFNYWILSSWWSQQFQQNNGKWIINRSVGDNQHDYYAQLDYVQSFNFNKPDYCKASLVCEPDIFNDQDYVLSFSYCSAGNGNSSDSLNVRVQRIGEENWKTISENRINKTLGWITKNIIISHDDIPGKISFDGAVGKSSIVRLDDIIIRAYPIDDSDITPIISTSTKVGVKNSCIEIHNDEGENYFKIYSLPDGHYLNNGRLLPYSKVSIPVCPGLFVVKTNSEIVKVIVH